MKDSDVKSFKIHNINLIELMDTNVRSIGNNSDCLQRYYLKDKSVKDSSEVEKTMIPYLPFKSKDNSKKYSVIEGLIEYNVCDELIETIGSTIITLLTPPTIKFDNCCKIIADYDYYSEFGIYFGPKTSFKILNHIATVDNIISTETFNQELFEILVAFSNNAKFITSNNRIQLINECIAKGINIDTETRIS